MNLTTIKCWKDPVPDLKVKGKIIIKIFKFKFRFKNETIKCYKKNPSRHVLNQGDIALLWFCWVLK